MNIVKRVKDIKKVGGKRKIIRKITKSYSHIHTLLEMKVFSMLKYGLLRAISEKGCESVREYA